MTQEIQVLAHSCIRIEGQQVIYFDPYLLTEEYHDAGVVFITHDHYDHFSPEDLAKVINKTTTLVLPKSMSDNAGLAQFDSLEKIFVEPGQSIEVKGMPIEVVAAYNTNKDFHKKEFNWVGYVVTINHARYFVTGDTDANAENLQVTCEVLLVPCGGTYTFTAEEAAEFANQLRPKIAIPTHYGSIVGEKTDGARFASLLDEGIRVEEKLTF